MSSSSTSTTLQRKLRVMLVDDSVVVRGMLRQMIDEQDDMEVVAAAINGRVGVEQYDRVKPDVVLMDVEMPVMSGIEALQEIVSKDPGAYVIMCSSLTQSGAQMAMKAMNIGAIDCLAKPSSTSIDRGDDFKGQLLRLLRSVRNESDVLRQTRMAKSKGAVVQHQHVGKEFTTRPLPSSLASSRPRVLVVGSSTGGPQALKDVISCIDANKDIPIFITQHMPAGFTKLLADSLAKKTARTTLEAEDEMLVKSGCIYIAPGGKHMTIEQRSSGYFIVLSDAPPVKFCKPSVDVMIDSILKAYKNRILTVILTGMGDDGLDSCRRLVEAHDTNLLVAQDELTSVVWGVPGAVAQAGLCHFVSSISNIAPVVNKLLSGQKPLI